MWEEAADIEMKTLDLDSEWKLGTVVPFLGKCRPFVGYCCQRCTPKSWEFFFHKNMISLGFCNVIKISEGNTRFRGWLVRRLCCFFTVCDWKICADTPSDLQKRIFHSKRVQDIVCQKVPQSKGDAPETSMPVPQWMQRIHSILCQIQSSVSPLLLRLSHWVLLKLLNQMFLGVIIHNGQLEMVRRAAEVPDVPVVFLSTHKSQLDRLLLQLLLISQGLGTPRVTCEYKTYPSKCRTLLALLGGVFLPQGVEQARDSEQGVLSRAVLASYVEEVLRSRQPLLIFLEEAFAGAPQVSASSREWLSLVFSAFHSGTVPDIMIVPIGISYDVAPDSGYRGKVSSTQTLSLWTSLWTICRAACRGLGCVRVDFAQPFSLQEYVANSLFRQSSSGKCLEELLLPEILGKRCSILDCEKLEQWSPGSKGIIALNTEQEILVYNLGLHTLSAGVSCSAIMAVQIMSALFLHKHKEGVFLSQLMQDFVWLTEEILLRSYDVGFSGQVRDVVLHALFLLRHCISLYHLSLGDVLVVPKKTDEAMTELSQHSTALLPVFIQEAVGVCAASALLVELLPYLGSPEQLRDVVLVQEELHNKTVLLVQLLPRDFLLCQPCQSLYNYCQVAVDKLIQCGLLVAEEMPSDVLVCDTAQKRFTKRLLWKATDDFADSDSDYSDETGNCCFKISQVENCSNFFVFLCCLLSPLLKTLERATVFLWEMESPQSESQYVEKLHCFLARKAKEDSSFECVCRTLTTISVRIYKELGVLREAVGQGEPILHLSETFRAKENQEKLEKFIQQFIYS
ncbi:glycerol-3-phosphate acyltransferase 2, mitochondrial isoform X1 [Podarcis lilfordi]|uniref:Glycerol-3-phosphate acyltransferase 2, mitochondrial isoform X1 n=2 Tax=Podarcis lilfordi TaxID=74358 RepID=A0AA35KU82_9SAUR|nr:glycerol-3-phosphate acyltransferase 2, mitochondrial isoform X1 [Podarcis lilfordi]